MIDSLGAQMSPDCPLAFVLEFDSRQAFVEYFMARHTAARDAEPGGTADIAAGNRACLVEVHRVELC